MMKEKFTRQLLKALEVTKKKQNENKVVNKLFHKVYIYIVLKQKN